MQASGKPTSTVAAIPEKLGERKFIECKVREDIMFFIPRAYGPLTRTDPAAAVRAYAEEMREDELKENKSIVVKRYVDGSTGYFDPNGRKHRFRRPKPVWSVTPRLTNVEEERKLRENYMKRAGKTPYKPHCNAGDVMRHFPAAGVTRITCKCKNHTQYLIPAPAATYDKGKVKPLFIGGYKDLPRVAVSSMGAKVLTKNVLALMQSGVKTHRPLVTEADTYFASSDGNGSSQPEGTNPALPPKTQARKAPATVEKPTVLENASGTIAVKCCRDPQNVDTQVIRPITPRRAYVLPAVTCKKCNKTIIRDKQLDTAYCFTHKERDHHKKMTKADYEKNFKALTNKIADFPDRFSEGLKAEVKSTIPGSSKPKPQKKVPVPPTPKKADIPKPTKPKEYWMATPAVEYGKVVPARSTRVQYNDNDLDMYEKQLNNPGTWFVTAYRGRCYLASPVGHNAVSIEYNDLPTDIKMRYRNKIDVRKQGFRTSSGARATPLQATENKGLAPTTKPESPGEQAKIPPAPKTYAQVAATGQTLPVKQAPRKVHVNFRVPFEERDQVTTSSNVGYADSWTVNRREIKSLRWFCPRCYTEAISFAGNNGYCYRCETDWKLDPPTNG